VAPASRVEEDAAGLGKGGPEPEIKEAVLLVAIPSIVLSERVHVGGHQHYPDHF